MVSREEFKQEVMGWARMAKVEPKEIHIRQMKRKWASCSSKGRLTFDPSLLEEGRKVRAEAILHELLHLRYPNHGKMFETVLRMYLEKDD